MRRSIKAIGGRKIKLEKRYFESSWRGFETSKDERKERI